MEAAGPPSPDEAMGHGGHGGMSMAAMVADMRNRFLVAVTFSVPIVVWSPIGEEVFGRHAPVPFGLRQDVWALLLSLPVIFYSCSIFFSGAVRALRARTGHADVRECLESLALRFVLHEGQQVPQFELVGLR